MGDRGGGGRRGGRGGDNRNRTSSAAPCPAANSTNIGSVQPFTLQCGLTVGGNTIDNSTQPDFLTCIDRCAFFHPRCEAVTYDGIECQLRAGSGASETKSSRRFDSAVGIFPSVQATSGCGGLGSSTTAGSSQFDLSCDAIIDGNDISQQHTSNFVDCMSLCSQTAGCSAVSYDLDMDRGFMNCYLKSANSAAGPQRSAGIDSAVVSAASLSGNGVGVIPVPMPIQAPVPGNPGPSSLSPLPNIGSASPLPNIGSASPLPEVVVLPTPQAIVTLTPLITANAPAPTGLAEGNSAASDLASASPPPPPTIVSATVTSLVTQTTTVEGGSTTTLVTETTQIVTLPVPSDGVTYTTTVGGGNIVVVSPPAAPTPGSEGGGTTATDGEATENEMSQAWIAAPVMGSIAAIVMIVVLVLLVKRKQERRALASPGRASAMTWAGFVGWCRGWLPRKRDTFRFGSSSWRRSPGEYFGGLWARRRGGNTTDKLRATEEGGGGSSRGTTRDGGFPFRLSAEPERTPTYEVRQGKVALRDSMNGLSQNKPNLDGIPEFLREKS